MIKNVKEILFYYDYEPLEFTHALFLIICCLPYWFGGISFYIANTNQELIAYAITIASIFQIIGLILNNLTYRNTMNTIQMILSIFILMDVDQFTLNNCFNIHATLSPALFVLMTIRTSSELYSRNESK
jgi:uncharacterized membrane protein